MEDKIKKILAVMLNLDKEIINENSSSSNIENWDSLKQMNITVALEDEFGIEFEDDEISQLNSYMNIFKLVSEKI